MNPVASIIVPAYNAGPYIQRCLQSLLSHDVPLEIIVVNDGSTDDTPKRAGAVDVPRYHNVRLIEQPNRGLSAARNAGLARARARFVGFVDADDWVESETFAVLVSTAHRHAADIVISNGNMVDHASGHTKPFQDGDLLGALAGRYRTVLDPRTAPDVFGLDTSVCRRLYRRSLLDAEGFAFADGLLYEDVLAHFWLLLATSRVSIVDQALYHYRINHAGRITDRTDAQVLTIFEILSRSEDVLTRRAASPEMWARFISLQSWVLPWLGGQIANAHRDEFAAQMFSLASRFSQDAVDRFNRRHVADESSRRIVAIQRAGDARMFWALLSRSQGAVPPSLHSQVRQTGLLRRKSRATR